MKTLELTGKVVSILGNNQYRVAFEHDGQERVIRCYMSGKMNLNKISVTEGDLVQVVLPPPFEMGRIIFRQRN